MANIKISELNELEEVENSDLLVIVDSSANETKKVKVENININTGKSMGSIVVDDISGKNLFDGTSMIELRNQVRRYSDGVVVSVSGYYGIKVPVKANTTYIVSSDLVDRNKISNLCYFNGDTYISGATFDTGSLSFTTPNNCNYITLAISNEYTWCQIELGTEATDFVPYKQPVKITDVGVKENTTFYANDFKCKNLYNENTDLIGYIINTSGEMVGNGNYRTSQLIPVQPNTTYTVSRVHNSSAQGAEDLMRVAYYQQNGTFIERPYSSDKPWTITTPSNCYYMRLSYNYISNNVTANSQVQLEIGEATPYTPYIEVAPSVETIDISSYKTSNVSSVSRAFVQRVGHIYKFNIVCTVGSASSTGVTLFTGLPFTPAFITELDTVNANNVTVRCFYDSGDIKISSAQASTYFINGIMII